MKSAILLGTVLLEANLLQVHSFTQGPPLQLRRLVNRREQAASYVSSLASTIPGTPDSTSTSVSFVVYDKAADEGKLSRREEGGGGIINNSALVAGNMVGAGVLALPQVTEGPGFLLSSAAMVAVWGYCLSSAIIVAECAGNGRETIQKMAEASVGRTAGNLMCASFLASNYLLLVAYISQGASLLPAVPALSSFLASFVGDIHLAPMVFTTLVGFTSLWSPVRFAEKANTALVGMIILSFGGLVALGLPHIDVESLGLTPDASALPSMLPVAVCALTFQNVVPTVSKNLGGDPIKIRSSLAIGSGVPLMSYILWNAVVLGNIGGIDSAGTTSPTDALGATSPLLGVLIAVFSMSAIVTSFWGASFSLMIECTHLVDAMTLRGSLWDTKEQPPIADDTRPIDERTHHDGTAKTAAVAMLVLLPPATISMTCPDSFATALQYVGTYVNPFLYGVAPAFMAYRLRDVENHKIQFPGGTAALAFVAAVTCGYMFWQTLLMTA